MKRLNLLFPYLFFGALILAVAGSNWGHVFGQHAQRRSTEGPGQKVVDPVCHMVVNVNWGVNADHQASRYHFCTQRCKMLFVHDPNAYLGARCMVFVTSRGDGDYVVY